MNEVLFSSKTDDWATPQYVFDQLNEEFHFTLDPCASDDNHKCEKYYTKEQDGLTKNWGGATCFVIHLTARSGIGLKRLTGKRDRITRLSFC